MTTSEHQIFLISSTIQVSFSATAPTWIKLAPAFTAANGLIYSLAALKIFDTTLAEMSVFEKRFPSLNIRDSRSIQKLCEELLTSKGEVSGYRLGQLILDHFDKLSEEEIYEFFRYITDELDVDTDAIITSVSAYKEEQSSKNLDALLTASEPVRQKLLRRINQVPKCHGATGSHWQSPASVLQKIIQYEAVHEIDDWDDLRRRVEPEDRRCYAFFHPSMPDDPLIFVEVALSNKVPTSVQEILASERDIVDLEAANTAVFYSISNCQEGNLLPFLLYRFSIGGLKQQEVNSDDCSEEELKGLAAKYLCEAKDKEGYPFDPVAKFHLNNGALINELHTNADISEKGKKQSSGVMVNYLYDLKSVEQNHEDYATEQKIIASKMIKSLLPKNTS
ncbi:Malonyl-CoA decarboxylase, mitochondrial [Nymphon striatum]|nr:Malonyl-CoA decarboxylase, mitochondrial [Nymphon striatum]